MKQLFHSRSMKRLVIAILVMLGMLAGTTLARAQVPGVNVARTLGITDQSAVEGDIVSLTNNTDEVELSKVMGDARMYGVLVRDPLVVYRTNESIPVVTTGEVFVNVTTQNGPIMSGDFITSSNIPGKGKKAEQSMRGYMLGYAMTGLSETEGEPYLDNGKQIRQGKIKVQLNIRPISFTGGNVLATLQQAQAASLDIIKDSQTRDRYFRYLIALLIVVFTVFFSYKTFGKNVSKGIEGIGRNPLAKGSIQAMIILNMVLIGAVCIGGMVLALLVISL
jgi:F0F1-type ATP synthase membrane subunit c/vacuolar-type H+-ATPase subunit K